MSEDFPQPFGPRIATCSPELIRKLKSSRATLSPRMTRTFFKSTRAGSMMSPKLSILSKTQPSHIQDSTSFQIELSQQSGFDRVAPMPAGLPPPNAGHVHSPS